MVESDVDISLRYHKDNEELCCVDVILIGRPLIGGEYADTILDAYRKALSSTMRTITQRQIELAAVKGRYIW